ncbi:helix-turn-helix domain-containing protein [Paenibacillus radicis (ex Xue et al. 2023)]|uniref:Helix-turn-helix domain-containing protein n=1 Tax=Paenibacillus radicis (ex Xue et al. 2023) TaxID=2972489 RepID=A0ABT1YUH6_9BACL|nr:helix-turn-helix transcriptional regulator [Paenibacillus radicis (ex Xue et al. 2023)]MCR8636178.1 helix-turn-helix domain-containing protein [Paenibacillus radicis (ex Xue et al. 2023)]
MSETEFGIYLKKARESKGVSVNQLALESGISNAQISRIENGRRGIPKPETIRKLAEALQIPYEAMMEKAGHMPDDHKQEIPVWATSRDKRDFKKMLEEDGEIMFDGIPINDTDKQRIMDVLTGFFWEAKQMNKRKKPKDSDDTKE